VATNNLKYIYKTVKWQGLSQVKFCKGGHYTANGLYVGGARSLAGLRLVVIRPATYQRKTTKL